MRDFFQAKTPPSSIEIVLHARHAYHVVLLEAHSTIESVGLNVPGRVEVSAPVVAVRVVVATADVAVTSLAKQVESRRQS